MSDGASAKVGETDQESGVTPNDFSNPVTYIVTAEDSSTKDWVVTVAVALPAQNGGPAFTAGTPATFGTELTVGEGTLETKTNLTYIWYRSDDNEYDGADTNLGTGLTYTPVAADVGNYLIVVVTSADATGTGVVVTDAVVSKATGPVAPAVPTVASKTDTSVTLTANALHQFSKDAGGNWQDSPEFTGLTAQTQYTFVARIKETATHKASEASAELKVTTAIPVTAIAAIGGTTKVGEELTAGALTPAEATVTYQWQRADTADGDYANIGGATGNKYTLVLADEDKFIKVVASGSGDYYGSVTSAATAAIGARAAVYNETQLKGYDTIQGALTAADEDDTILVGSGTYEEALTISVKDLTLKSDEGNATTIIDAKEADYAVQVASSGLGTITFEGFTVTGWKKGGINQPMGSGGVDSAFIVLNNKVIAPVDETVHGNSIQVSGDGSVVEGNIVEAGSHVGETYNASGILVVNASDVTVKQNEITGVDAAISVQGGKWGSKAPATDITILDNTIDGTKVGISVEYSASKITIKDNNITDVTWAVQKVSEDSLVPTLDLEEVFSKNTFPPEFAIIGDVIMVPTVFLSLELGMDNSTIEGNTVKLTKDITIDSEITIPTGVTLHTNGKVITGDNGGKLEVYGTLYATGYGTIDPFWANGGTANFYPDSNWHVGSSATFIGKDGEREVMSISQGFVKVEFETRENDGVKIIVPEGSEASILSYHNSGTNDDYRIAANDSFYVEGILNINYKTLVTGQIEVVSGGKINVGEDVYVHLWGGIVGGVLKYVHPRLISVENTVYGSEGAVIVAETDGGMHGETLNGVELTVTNKLHKWEGGQWVEHNKP